MTQLTWNRPEDRIFEAGIDRGVFYPQSGPGVAWNGLVSVVENPEESESSNYYQDGVKTYTKVQPAEYSSTLEAYTYPEEFEEYDGLSTMAMGLLASDQPRRHFNLSYRSKIGSDIHGLDYGYKIHLLYNAIAVPTTRSYMTLTENPEIFTFSWGLKSFPTDTPPGFRPSSHFIIDSRRTDSLAVKYIESLLYGSDNENPRMPTVIDLFKNFEEWNVLYPSRSSHPSSATYPGVLNVVR